ncbi:hypothetical protein BJV74DRAFT_869619 [Russula compacta]|nr:hypothetical protein BJV74DRAFT_869619 [Russula compacta]
MAHFWRTWPGPCTALQQHLAVSFNRSSTFIRGAQMPDDFENREVAQTLYFGYGSNLWIDQMNRRCPESRYVGIGLLPDWRWIINERGYANVIPSSGDYVYGFIYELSPKDEESLDKIIPVQLITPSRSGETDRKRTIDALVYIDFIRTSRDVPKPEYIYRMNQGLKDALKMGISQSYIDKYIRPYIPPS